MPRATVHIFFRPVLAKQLATGGITTRPGLLSSTTPRGFVLARRAAHPPGGRAVTHVIDKRGHVTITGQRRLPVESSVPPTPTVLATGPQTALKLAEECARLQRDNQRLSDEVNQLRAALAHRTAEPEALRLTETTGDGSARRFALLELE